ncbi:MAG: DUF483 domain-containing protein [Candidatus Verstraetearchaeota archaeon]|nr:DUF483 domain-containing protein [Candidatus Verstraetearchaeota archaeon]
MTSKGVAVTSFLRILSLLKDLSSIDDPSSARTTYPAFPSFAEHIAKLFSEDRLFDVLPRLAIQLGIIRRYDPPVRPAMDPYVSTQIGVFSKNFSDWEIGSFLGYPDCCMRPYAEELRYSLDEEHVRELKQVKGRIFVTTAGFIPHSVFCKESHLRGLIAFIAREDVERLRLLENELSSALPHLHPEYQRHYYEIRNA